MHDKLGQSSAILTQAISHSRLPLCITDPNKPDNPIVFVNNAFCILTGYEAEEVLGQNCRMLQGPETEAERIERLRLAIANQHVTTIELLNYRKDGSSFVNALQIGPIYDDDGQLRYYFGSQLDVTARVDAERHARKIADAEFRHRLMNIVTVLTTLVRQTGRDNMGFEQTVGLIAKRIEAVGKAHLITLTDGSAGSTDLAQIIDVILSAYTAGNEKRITTVGPTVEIGNGLLTAMALTLHELATNGIKHGALSAPRGQVSVVWQIDRTSGEARLLKLTWIETGGPEVEPSSRSSGSQIVAKLLEASGGAIEYDWRESGLVATIILPMY